VVEVFMIRDARFGSEIARFVCLITPSETGVFAQWTIGAAGYYLEIRWNLAGS